MGIIRVNNIRLYAYHGCMAEEAIVGSDYRVDVCVHADLEKAALSDDLEDTVDYVRLREIVEAQMKQRAKLLEVVAKRIVEAYFAEFQKLSFASVCIAKINPPIQGDVESVSVTYEKSRP
ncbi:MAG: dihydroneopterin aldolase [Flavobacteriaceae bacterium]